jgi:hypothetical protein
MAHEILVPLTSCDLTMSGLSLLPEATNQVLLVCFLAARDYLSVFLAPLVMLNLTFCPQSLQGFLLQKSVRGCPSCPIMNKIRV